MIVFDLQCRSGGHVFEGWFGSSEDFSAQFERGLVTCPHCGTADVSKAPMAPNVGRKGNQSEAVPQSRTGRPSVAGGELTPQAAAVLQAMAAMQGEALKGSRWVGGSFAEVSREIHYGEREGETIHGQATAREAMELVDEGIEIMPLPFPVAAPDETN